jgi:FkbM family methyltransferase
MLPFTFLLHRIEGTCEPELLHLDQFIASTGTAIDIGANVGLYTYALSKRFDRVYSFEINESVSGLITKYNPGNIELIHCGLSSSAGAARFYVPVASGMTLAGWGSLNKDNLPGAEKLIEKDVELKRLDDFGIAGVGLIKIDVEGHEVEVLKGAGETIQRSRPIVLVELKKEHMQDVKAWFLEFDFKHCRLEDFAGVPGHRSNHIFVPFERLAQFGIARPSN